MQQRHGGPSGSVKDEMTMKEKRAAIYVRVSTSEQDTGLKVGSRNREFNEPRLEVFVVINRDECIVVREPMNSKQSRLYSNSPRHQPWAEDFGAALLKRLLTSRFVDEILFACFQ